MSIRKHWKKAKKNQNLKKRLKAWEESIMGNISFFKFNFFLKFVYYYFRLYCRTCMNTMYHNLCLIGLSYTEWPILCDNPKVHNHDNKKRTLFVKSLKNVRFSWKSPKNVLFIWEITKTADSTQIFHLDLVFHRVQWEGQLGVWSLVEAY